MIVGTAAERPVIFSLAFLDREIVDASNTQPHQAVLVKLPIFVAIAAKPATTVVVPLVGKANGDAIVAESPNFLD